jgi:hypothetical protein
MARVLFGFPIWSDVSTLYTPTLSGGSWVAGLPLTNLQAREQALVARSSSAAVADTQFTVDMGTARAVRCLAMAGHNFSALSGGVRVRGLGAVPILDAGANGFDAFLSGWTANGTPTRTANAKTATSGHRLDLLGDDDGAAAENYSRAVTFTGDGQKIIVAYHSEGASPPAAGAAFILRDSTAAADRLAIGVTYVAGVPSYSQTTGTVVSSTSVGNGVYRVIMLSTAVTAANTNSLAIRPVNTAAQTGNWYVGSVMAFDVATDPIAYDYVYGGGVGELLPTGTTAEDREGWNPTWIRILDTDYTARYWRINISDTSNPDGYVEIGRLLITGGIQPAINASVGCTLGWANDRTVRTETDGGATLYNTRRRRREATLLLEQQTDAEAHGALDTMKQRAGTSGQFLFVYDPDDTTLAWKRQFVAVLRELSPVQYPKPTYRATPLAVIEEL